MPSSSRSLVSGGHYHIYNRGNHKEGIFRDKDDRVYFLSKLDEYCERDGQSLLAYCLMDNHFHLALRQGTREPLSATMRSLLAGYVVRYNKKYGLVGRLFQERFRAKPVDDEEQMARLTRYIHLNPHPFDDFRTFRWSSYRQYVGRTPGICDVGSVLDTFGGSKYSYAIYVEKAVSPGERKPPVRMARPAAKLLP